MKITGPFLDPTKRGQPKPWFLRVRLVKLKADGSGAAVDPSGEVLWRRWRPYYPTRDAAELDVKRITAEYGSSGSGAFLFNRDAAAEYETTKRLVPNVPLSDLARFWLLHHPTNAPKALRAHKPDFLADVEARLGRTAWYQDLDSRLDILFATFGDRIPNTITPAQALQWLHTFPGGAKTGRTVYNLKTTACAFFNWLKEQGAVDANPFAGIKKRRLPKIVQKEIRFLDLDYSERYLRTLERYDPEFVAHEVVQLLAGVRADDEMANFSGDFVLSSTREVLIPSDVAKTGKREVINSLEPIFWDWWAVYGRKGILRPPNYPNRWRRVRILATISDPVKADDLARISAHELALLPEFAPVLSQWPWNARRRTFCTYHVAKYESADKTALILRQIGGTETLFNSYRGLGVNKAQGRAYFSRKPQPVDSPITAGGQRGAGARLVGLGKAGGAAGAVGVWGR